MKIYKTQQEVEKDIKNGELVIEGDVKFECSISISASIKVNAGDIIARNISAWNISAGDINAGDIIARNISAWDISAGDIIAGDIIARNISYYAFCLAYKSIKCLSWEAKRENHREPICLDGKLEVRKKEKTVEQILAGLSEEDQEIIKKSLK